MAACRALRVLCAAPSQEALRALKRAAVAAEWELVGGATSVPELRAQLEDWQPQVVVVDATLGAEAVQAVRELGPNVRLVTVGEMPGADDVAARLEDVKAAILGIPRMAGPAPA